MSDTFGAGYISGMLVAGVVVTICDILIAYVVRRKP